MVARAVLEQAKAHTALVIANISKWGKIFKSQGVGNVVALAQEALISMDNLAGRLQASAQQLEERVTDFQLAAVGFGFSATMEEAMQFAQHLQSWYQVAILAVKVEMLGK